MKGRLRMVAMDTTNEGAKVRTRLQKVQCASSFRCPLTLRHSWHEDLSVAMGNSLPETSSAPRFDAIVQNAAGTKYTPHNPNGFRYGVQRYVLIPARRCGVRQNDWVVKCAT